jgi:hypothetical protein
MEHFMNITLAYFWDDTLYSQDSDVLKLGTQNSFTSDFCKRVIAPLQPEAGIAQSV